MIARIKPSANPQRVKGTVSMIGVNQRERCIGIKLYFERDSHLSSKPTIRRPIPQRDWSFWWVIGDTKAR